VPVQAAHATFADLEADARKILVEFDFEGDSEPLQKVLDGLHTGLPLHGPEVIEEWRVRTAYTPELQRALTSTTGGSFRSGTSKSSSPRATPRSGSTR
jgi:hypothetical protein